MPKKTKDVSTGALINASSDIKATANVKVTDIGGIGALGKTPAGKAIAQTVGTALADTIRLGATAFLGAKATRVEADRIVALAQASGEAKLIEADTEAKLLSRAGERIRSDEIRRQSYIEDATRKAIEIADAKSSKKQKDLDPELVLTWIDGVKDAHSQSVRDLYSELMASYAAGKTENVRGPSLMLLKQLDGNLARKFADFFTLIVIYGSYPYMGAARPADDFALSDADVAYLVELGFIKDVNSSYFKFGNLLITSGIGSFALFHGMLYFTQRGFEIANAVFDSDTNESLLKDRPSKESAIIGTYYNVMMESFKDHGGTISLKRDDKVEGILIYSSSNTSKIKFEDLLSDDRVANLPETVRKAIQRVHEESDYGFRIAPP